MINSTNVLGKHNPQWLNGNAPETIEVPDLRVTGVASPGDAIRRAFAIVGAWLAGLPRRVGRRLFYMNDLEARWRGGNWVLIRSNRRSLYCLPSPPDVSMTCQPRQRASRSFM